MNQIKTEVTSNGKTGIGGKGGNILPLLVLTRRTESPNNSPDSICHTLVRNFSNW